MTLLCLCSLTETGGSYKVFLIRSTLRHWVPLFSYGFCEELLFYLVWCYCLVWRCLYLELGKTENMNFLLTFSMSLLILWLMLILLVFPFSRCCSNSFLYDTLLYQHRVYFCLYMFILWWGTRATHVIQDTYASWIQPFRYNASVSFSVSFLI